MTADDWNAERYRKQRRKWRCSFTLGVIAVAITAPILAALRITRHRRNPAPHHHDK